MLLPRVWPESSLIRAATSCVKGGHRNFFRHAILSRTNSLGVPRVRAVVGLRPPLLVGYTRKGLVRVPHQVRGESGKALKNGRDTGAQSCRRSVDAIWHKRSKPYLFLGESPLVALQILTGNTVSESMMRRTASQISSALEEVSWPRT